MDKRVIPIVLLAVFGVLIVTSFTVMRRRHEATVRELQNKLAESDKTLEMTKGLYTKRAMEVDDLKSLLDTKSEQVVALQKQLKKNREELVAVAGVNVILKNALEGNFSPDEIREMIKGAADCVSGKPVPKKIEFKKDFGYLSVKGYVVTDPLGGFVSVKQNRPLKLSLAISQGEDRAWRAYAISVDENVQIDIGNIAISPRVFKQKWYERIGLTLGGGAGSSVLLTAGASLDVGQFSVGPAAWLSFDGAQRYFGANMTWRPFKR